MLFLGKSIPLGGVDFKCGGHHRNAGASQTARHVGITPMMKPGGHLVGGSRRAFRLLPVGNS